MRSIITNARRDVAALRRALLLPSPEEIGRSMPALIDAAHALAAVEADLRKQPEKRGEQPELRAELNALLTDLRLANQLIEHGAALQQGWATLLGAATAGYTPSGEAAPLSASGAISVQG